MRDEPDLNRYKTTLASSYESLNYSGSLAARMMRKSHELLEFTMPGLGVAQPEILEVGAGLHPHLSFLKRDFKKYVVSDLEASLIEFEQSSSGRTDSRVEFAVTDAAALSFGSSAFDQVIAAHILEHIPNPIAALKEWFRVARNGGLISIILPCDPALLWRIGRHFGPRRSALSLGIDYDYWMAREHINSIFNLVSLISYYFPDRHDHWFPARIACPDLNLFYLTHLRVRK